MSFTPSLLGDISGPTANNLVTKISGPSPIFITPSVLEWNGNVVSPSLIHATNVAAANGTDLLIAAQDSTNPGAFASGNLLLRAGRSNVGGSSPGDVVFQVGTVTTFEIARFVFLPHGVGFAQSGLNFDYRNNVARITVANNLNAGAGITPQIIGGTPTVGPNADAGGVAISTGLPLGTGLRGNISFTTNRNNINGTMMTIGEFASGSRLINLFGANLVAPGAAPGDFVMCWRAAVVAPTANPGIGNMLIYVDPVNSSLKARGSSGTITTMAPAEPHCPRCGMDFALEWENPDANQHLAVCVPCLMISLDRAGIRRSDYVIVDKNN